MSTWQTMALIGQLVEENDRLEADIERLRELVVQLTSGAVVYDSAPCAPQDTEGKPV